MAWRLSFLLGFSFTASVGAQECTFLDPASAAKFAAVAAICPSIAVAPASAGNGVVVVDRPSVAVSFAGWHAPALRHQQLTGAAPRRSGAHELLVDDIALSHRIDPLLLSAIVTRESAGRADAVSPKGARGLLQVMPATARGLGVADMALLADPRINLATGATYLKQMQARFGGDLALTLAAYNAGPGAVARHHGVPPYAETRAYVASILARYRAARLAGVAR